MSGQRIFTQISMVLILAVSICLSFPVSGQAPTPTPSPVIDPALETVISSGATADFLVTFSEQADLAPAYTMDWDSRGEFVYQALQETAQRSQADAQAYLTGRGIAYKSFIAGNELFVYAGDAAAVSALSVSAKIASIQAKEPAALELLPPVEVSAAGPQPAQTSAIEWNISDTRAPDFWAAYNRRGEGIRVGIFSTGVKPDHAALSSKFACGTDFTNPSCWLDASGVCSGVMCDQNGIGTFATGIVLGGQGSLNQIGMAPDATWIACNAYSGGSLPAAFLNACFDWFLAPGGNPANRPQIILANWTISTPGDTMFQAKVQALRAAGIFPVFSAGNSGPACSTIRSPGAYPEAFASASHDNTRTIASFSSRGPSVFGDTPYLKPSLSAPGVAVRSSWNDGAYSTVNGGSVSSAHIAGAVALLWSLYPDLVGSVDRTMQVLQNGADLPPADPSACGTPLNGPGNYTYGAGYLNVLASAQLRMQRWWVEPAAPFEYNRFDCAWFDDGSGRSVYNQRVYCMGGRNNTSYLSAIWMFDPFAKTWTDTGRDMVTPVANYHALVLKDAAGLGIYVVSGHSGPTIVSPAVQRFYPKTGTVEQLSEDPWPFQVASTAVNPGGCAVANQKIYCFGGYTNLDAPYVHAQTWEYDPGRTPGSRWQRILTAELSVPRAYIQVAVDGSTIYAMGGDSFDGGTLTALTTVEALNVLNLAAGWQVKAPLPVASGEGQGFAWASRLYVAGGGAWPDRTAEVQEYDVAANTWNIGFTDLWYPRRDQAGVLIPLLTPSDTDPFPSMWVFGGNITGDVQPFGRPEYYLLPSTYIFMPLALTK